MGLVPVVLGGGIALLPTPAAPAKPKLTNQRVYAKSGIVGLEYDVVQRKAGR